ESTSPYRVCWKNEYVSSDEDWEFVAANQNGTITPRTGTSMAEFSTTTPSGDVTKFVTPSLDISALNHPQLEFYFANVSWLGDIDELRIYYKTSATGAWTQIGMDYTAEHTTWTKVTLSLPNPSNDYYIAFEGTSNYGRGLDVDDVWVGEGTAACEAPSNLTASNVGSTSADLSWDPAATGGPFEYEWAVFATGADPDVDTPIDSGITAIGTTTATATGLTADTMYDFYVRTICVPGTQSYSDIVGPETFSTTLGIEDQVFEDFSYYPNPVSGTLSLKASQEIQQVVVYDLLGQEVLKNTPDSLTPTLNFHNLQTGTYLMKVTINGAVGIYRIIKE
ncbi:MAG TPA: T9SS type A sorting domain-containing protein, partial [Flavobacteriaceae bacterium]|nr:T9SS type A sorting domain-containing protein [Flavobacteriaceae bacterium]